MLTPVVAWFANVALAETPPASSNAPDASCRAPWVAIDFEWQTAFQRFEPSVMADLRAGFAGRDIDVCLAQEGPSQAPLAIVTLEAAPARSVVSIEIRDTLTDKRLGRDVDLGAVPRDGHALAIALATDELVWASWAVLALERRARRKPVAAPHVEHAIEQELPHPRTLSPRLSLRGAGEVFGGGQRYLGPEGALSLPVGKRLRLDFSVGVRRGMQVEAPSGSISSEAVGGSTELRYLLLRNPNFELGAAAFGYGARIHLRGRPAGSATGSDVSLTALYAGCRLLTEWRLWEALWLGVSIYSAGPVIAAEAMDGDQVATGASGVLLGTQLGLGVEL